MSAASGTQQSAEFPRGIARGVTPLSLWGGDTVIYRSIIALSAIALPLLAAVSWYVRGAVAWPQLELAGATLVAGLLCYGLTRHGRHDIAAALMIGVIWCSATIYALGSGYGMHSAVVFMYLPCVLYTALFFGLTLASAELALTVVALVLMYLAEESGRLGGVAAFSRHGTNLTFLVGVIVTSVGTLVVGVVYHRRVESEAARVVAEAEQRRVAMEQAQTAQAQLETAHAALVAMNARLAARDRSRGEEIARAGRELALLHAALAKDLPAALRAGGGAAEAIAVALEELAQYGSRPLRNERLDLSALAREAEWQARAQPGCAHVKFDIDPGLRAFGDREMVVALLRRLGERAARACLAEPEPWVHVGAGSREGRLLFFVNDNGRALDAAQLAQLTQPFGHGAARPDTAVACARLIAECHGGDFAVDSAPGKGTTVYFSLPA
jgi:signal transduction histidine kinase